MDKDLLDHRKFLEEQLEWSKQQSRILDRIDEKLHEMKHIAEYAINNCKLTYEEINKLNLQLSDLKDEIYSLENSYRL
ncbi:hypothetical protein [Aquibacillus rhizosphaerae]|uniref:Uncharacterized protein n=1 Tax=Aquibacillus rhizosphaerae TaxID=3051431 RepID=A0ABT7L234_9BACI|nr:hypothetical protein [Aquibacillus sp. LR5S19]MDL4839225.1 hypothetical protein [Aquibacillus sp. LR5S19]